MAMHILDEPDSSQKTNQVFRFFIRGGEVTRATVTIYATDIDVAWNRLHILFPGSDAGDIEAEYVGHGL